MKFEQIPQAAPPSAELPKKTELEEISPHRFEEARKHWKTEQLEVNGRTVELIGVSHEPATLRIPEYQKKIEAAIANAAVVVLEGGPDMRKLYSLDLLLKLMKEPMPEASRADALAIYKSFENDPLILFFTEIQAMAARALTDIATLDPSEDLYKSVRLEYENIESEKDKETLLVLAITTFFGSGAGLAFREMQQRRQAEKSGGMSRRTFLKAMAGSAAVAGMSQASILASENTYSYQDREENPLSFALYNSVDYRDVTIAEGIDKLTKESEETGPIEVIYGSKHIAGIRHYLENPVERKARLLAYGPFSGSPEDTFKVFTYDGGWRRKG